MEEQKQLDNGLVVNPPEATKSAAEVEQDILTEQQKAQKDPMQGLSDMITLYKFPFTNLVNKLSNNSLRRLCIDLVLVPLEDPKINKNNKDEKMAFIVGEELMKAKITMIHYTMLQEQMKQEQLKQELAKSNESLATTPETVVESVVQEQELVKE
jgi:hypothetical protein